MKEKDIPVLLFDLGYSKAIMGTNALSIESNNSYIRLKYADIVSADSFPANANSNLPLRPYLMLANEARSRFKIDVEGSAGAVQNLLLLTRTLSERIMLRK